jgi:hypothetical protein
MLPLEDGLDTEAVTTEEEKEDCCVDGIVVKLIT